MLWWVEGGELILHRDKPMRAKTILPADPPNSPEMQLQIIWACFRSSDA